MTARLSLVAAAAAMAFASSAYAATTLTVYTALEADQVAAYKAAFEKANPDIDIKWVRDSTGVLPPSCWPRRTIRAPT
jgi:iron(III) transport system substrate-binding protein